MDPIRDRIARLRLLKSRGRPDDEINQKHIDIAKSAQTVYEKTFFNLLNYLYSKYKISNLTLSGGCAMNSVANGKILKKTFTSKRGICIIYAIN